MGEGWDFPVWMKMCVLFTCALGGLFVITTLIYFTVRPKPGVAFTEPPTLREELDELQAEIARLRDEVERLKKGGNPPPSESITADASPR
jgi:hypothetical protein